MFMLKEDLCKYIPATKRITKTAPLLGRCLLAPGVGFEPTTKGLTVLCATAALPRNVLFYHLSTTAGLKLPFSFYREGSGVSEIMICKARRKSSDIWHGRQ
jgi:hypothetical protein